MSKWIGTSGWMKMMIVGLVIWIWEEWTFRTLVVVWVWMMVEWVILRIVMRKTTKWQSRQEVTPLRLKDIHFQKRKMLSRPKLELLRIKKVHRRHRVVSLEMLNFNQTMIMLLQIFWSL